MEAAEGPPARSRPRSQRSTHGRRSGLEGDTPMLRRLILAALLPALLLVGLPAASADDDHRRREPAAPPTVSPDQPKPREPGAGELRPESETESTVGKMGKKLVRGIVNVLTGWFEFFKQIARTCKEDGAGKGLTLGLLKGVGMTIARTGAGVLDTALFMAPFPDDYKPMLEPALVFD